MTYIKLSRMSKLNFLAKVVEAVKITQANKLSFRKDIHLWLNNDHWFLEWTSLEGFTNLPPNKKQFESFIDNRLKRAIREKYILIESNRCYKITKTGNEWLDNFDYDF